MNYQNFRENNIKKTFENRDKLRKNHFRNTSNLQKQKQNLEEGITYFIENSNNAFELIAQLKKMKENYKFEELCENIIDTEKLSKTEEKELKEISSDPKARRKFRKETANFICQKELKLNSISYNAQNSIKNLRKYVRSSIPFRTNSKEAIEFEKEINNYLGNITIKDYTEIKKLKEFFESKNSKKFLDSFDNFLNFLKSYNPKISTEELKKISKENIDYLIKSSENEKLNNSKKYAKSLEGKILKYSTYNEELKKNKKINDEDDLKYFEFLEEKENETFSTILDSKYNRIESAINNLVSKDKITEDDSTYILAKIKKSSEKTNLKKDIPTLEDVRLRALILQEDFEISPEESFKIAELTTNESLLTITKEFRKTLERDIRRSLLKQNPELFLLDKSKAKRFTTTLKDILNETREFSNINDFNIEKCPEGFSSFSNLRETMEKLDSLKEKKEKKEIDSKISFGDRKEIKETFRNWDGRNLTKQMKIVLKKHNLSYDCEGKNHAKITSADKNFQVIIPKTSSDWRMGRNFASELIKNLENNSKD